MVYISFEHLSAVLHDSKANNLKTFFAYGLDF